MSRLAALVSIHDVAPPVLDQVERIVDALERWGAPGPLLLVVPNTGWKEDDLRRLRGLAARGCPLAGHGWEHIAPTPSTIYHRIHALVLSRDQAEHLSRSRHELIERVDRCHAWFGSVGLESPSLYVPPAWALGSLTNADLRALPFRYFESLRGFVDSVDEVSVTLPVVGYEADTRRRALGLRIWNRAQLAIAGRTGRPLRLTVHPHDLDLMLAADLERDVRGVDRHVDTLRWLDDRATETSAAG